jgi:YD repeat-containing protein
MNRILTAAFVLAALVAVPAVAQEYKFDHGKSGSIKVTYNATCFQITVTDQDGRQQTYDFNDFGRPCGVTSYGWNVYHTAWCTCGCYRRFTDNHSNEWETTRSVAAVPGRYHGIQLDLEVRLANGKTGRIPIFVGATSKHGCFDRVVWSLPLQSP